MQTIYETIGIGYVRQGDYLIPNIKVEDNPNYEIGLWGQRYRRYLKQNHKVIYYNYLTAGTLYEHLSEIDKRAEEMFDSIVKSLAEKDKVNEVLKAKSPMIWVGEMNNIRNQATEIVMDEVLSL
ncbi:TnpV protein [Clostridiaceae bacterium DONG20-135]|uniref:TnpV protein n=1 Tax=Copranaerobaculum intestinale TaxID=2692629 RepID=A0A6N8U521_9FIRM|nr:TnpV protein [Copranaerobaculum intestinale]MXQ73050.1 TnpV protein [Copranaerobaculum intestinale]